MPCVVWGELTSNLDKDTEAYQFLQEINNHYGFEKVVVTKHVCKTILKSYSNYCIYIKINEHEHQKLMVFKQLDLQDIECYLLGHLHGLGK